MTLARIVILCGGSGTRLQDYSLPKPLNMIRGRPAIYHVLQHLPSALCRSLHFVVAPHLEAYSFESVVRQAIVEVGGGLAAVPLHFHRLPYFTRGPVESAFLGLKDLPDDEEASYPVVFLDNDVLYTFPPNIEATLRGGTAFLGYATDTTGSEAFSFVRRDEATGFVLDIKEKKRISDQFVCGVYGFASLSQFCRVATAVLGTLQPKELYMSMVFERLLLEGEPVMGVAFPSPIRHIGSLHEVREALPHIPTKCLRICFDLDNTLVTAPRVAGDYSTCEPITKTVAFAQALRAAGHTIIIHTARRMGTHKHNVGAAVADVARVTLDTLDAYGIPYDELVFGKPLADMYVDDKALNPYMNAFESFGFFEAAVAETPLNGLPPNKHNTVRLEKGCVVKRGPLEHMRGEIFYYTHLPPSGLRNLFPAFLGTSLVHCGGGNHEEAELRLEHVKGIPFYNLWAAGLLTTAHIDLLFEHMDRLHSAVDERGIVERPTAEHMMANYGPKLRQRWAAHAEVYQAFPDSKEVMEACLEALTSYTGPEGLRPVHYIHGDLWFSNILLKYNNTLAFLDMRGACGDLLTLGGDAYYDYAKVYQSVCGYDSALYGFAEIPGVAVFLRAHVEHCLVTRGVCLDRLKAITRGLVLGTLPFVASVEARRRIWEHARTAYST